MATRFPGLGKRIREARSAKGMTQEELARAVGVSAAAVGHWEHERADPPMDVLYYKICPVLERPLSYFLMTESEQHQIRRAIEADVRRDLDRVLGITRVPVLGYIRAGSPQWSEATDLGALTLPRELIPEGADVYALQVVGDSMVGAGLYDGDYVIVRKQDWADPGQIVIARVNHGQEATIKYLVRDDKGQYWLRAAHPDRTKYPDIPIRQEDDRVQGVLIGKYTTRLGPAAEEARVAPFEGRGDDLTVDKLVELLSRRTGVDQFALRAFLEALKKQANLATGVEPLPGPPSG